VVLLSLRTSPHHHHTGIDYILRQPNWKKFDKTGVSKNIEKITAFGYGTAPYNLVL
jgi:hypothetical protein